MYRVVTKALANKAREYRTLHPKACSSSVYVRFDALQSIDDSRKRLGFITKFPGLGVVSVFEKNTPFFQHSRRPMKIPWNILCYVYGLWSTRVSYSTSSGDDDQLLLSAGLSTDVREEDPRVSTVTRFLYKRVFRTHGFTRDDAFLYNIIILLW